MWKKRESTPLVPAEPSNIPDTAPQPAASAMGSLPPELPRKKRWYSEDTWDGQGAEPAAAASNATDAGRTILKNGCRTFKI